MANDNLESLMVELEEIAKAEADGHITILKFTTGWKAAFGTPNLDIGEEREKLLQLQSHSTYESAVKDLIKNKVNLYNL
jgi:hypothetical protein